MPLVCSELIRRIEEKYPLNLAEDFDNVGLLIGDENKNIGRVLLALDVTEDVVQEAIDSSVDIIVAHHPVIFNPIKRIVKNDPIGSLLMKLIKADINVYSLHTNFDNASDGMNDILSKLLDLRDIRPLVNNWPIKLYKLVVFVPETHHNSVMSAILDSGAGHIGNYSHCSFNSKGIGTFMPLKGSSPFLGTVGSLERANEVRIETIVDESRLQKVLSCMKKAHPYEEIAYDLFLLNNTLENGTGRIGSLQSTQTFEDFCKYVKVKLDTPYISSGGSMTKPINKVAVVGGAGMDFLKEAASKGADVLITGDIKHHEALDAIAMGLNVIDAGHYHTEALSLPLIRNFILALGDVECLITSRKTGELKRI